MRYCVLCFAFGGLLAWSMLEDYRLDRSEEAGYTPAQIRAVDDYVAKRSARPILFRPRNEAERVAVMRDIFVEERR